MSVLNLSWDQVRDFEGHKYKSATPVVCKIYEFYHNEDNRLPEVEYPVVLSKKDVNVVVDEDSKVIPVESVVEVQTRAYPDKDIIAMKDVEIEHLRKINEELKAQLKRYEKLIDRL